MTDTTLNQPHGLSAHTTPPSHDPGQPQREPGNAPEGEPGNRWATPEAERPVTGAGGTVSDPDEHATERGTREAGGGRGPGAGTVSNPDF